MRRLSVILPLLLAAICFVAFTGVAVAVESPGSDGPPASGQSPYLIVEFAAPPLAAVYRTQLQAASADGGLDANSASAQAYVAELQSQQAAFVSQMQAVLPNATVGEFYTDARLQQKEALTYQVVFNGMAINPGTGDLDAAARLLAKMPGVKAVYRDRPHYTDLYTSTLLINAPAVWNVLGGRENAGAGVKFASVDGGVHHLAPMFSGEGYTYPNGFGPRGKGQVENNNGKIITSRAYFREWDPPQTEDLGLPQTQCGDACAWPGPEGTPHGVHTSSIAAGNIVTASYLGLNLGTISGVAPRAYVMSYKVFYGSVTGDESFFNAEGIAALEDVAVDGADVLNNSWGGGPTSRGGPGDPLDTALVNLAASGVFVTMSAGNSGPSFATQDHPSPDYINVAATTSGGTLAAGTLSVPGQPGLENIAFTTAAFGQQLPLAQVITYTVLPASSVNPANVEGCSPWPAGTFAGRAALIRRGACEFGVKVLNAEQAGAEFVIVYNNLLNGDTLTTMAAGAVGDQVTISAILIGNTPGEAIVAAYTSNPSTTVVLNTTIAFQRGNTPDVVAPFSSRGAAVGNVLKPDIAAPGVNILAQGYTPGLAGTEEEKLGYGQASGTSFAAPHVAGAAVLVRQAYPSWSIADIKSALMSTAKYIDIFNADGSPAQPLDIGAGRLDLTHVLDPGVILDPPSLSFGLVQSGTVDTIVVTVTSVATQTETYQLSTLDVGNGFTQTTALQGFSVSPASITLDFGQSTQVTVTVDSNATPGIGDSQGYILLDGLAHEAHMPAWARVTPATPTADVLIIDNDGSGLDPTFGDYVSVYTSTVQALGFSYNVVNTADNVSKTATIPGPAELAGYGAVLWFTGADADSEQEE